VVYTRVSLIYIQSLYLVLLSAFKRLGPDGLTYNNNYYTYVRQGGFCASGNMVFLRNHGNNRNRPLRDRVGMSLANDCERSKVAPRKSALTIQVLLVL
jgi:hypothetical protein